MSKSFDLSILTPAEEIARLKVISVQVPTPDGLIGVLANHHPLISVVAPGALTVKNEDGSEQVFAVSGGFFEVTRAGERLLVDTAEPAEKIDVDRALAAKKRALDRLREHKDIDASRAQAALMRSLARLKAHAHP